MDTSKLNASVTMNVGASEFKAKPKATNLNLS